MRFPLLPAIRRIFGFAPEPSPPIPTPPDLGSQQESDTGPAELAAEFIPQPKDEGQYWKKRAELYYYQVVKEWIAEEEPGEWVIDVGSRSTPVALEGRFKRRTMVDLDPFFEEFDGVEQVVTDWMEYPIEGKADLVLCLQVLEHLEDELVAPFSKKLLASGKRAIISVPHKWPNTACEQHLQDPVDLEMLIGWVGKEPTRHYVETRDRKERLIALFESKD